MVTTSVLPCRIEHACNSETQVADPNDERKLVKKYEIHEGSSRLDDAPLFGLTHFHPASSYLILML